MRETAGQHCLKFNLQCSLFNKAINVTVSVTVKPSFIQSLKGENQLSVYITEVSAVYYKGIIVACVASVSSRGSSRKLGQEQKK